MPNTSSSAPSTESKSKWTAKLNYEAIFWISLVHVVSFIAIPFFTWSAFGVCMLLLFTISPIGITLGYHRLLTHRAFKVPRWLEYTLAMIGTLSAQGSPLEWVAGHRLHHAHADTPEDPHSPRKGFFFSHMGHLLLKKEHEVTRSETMKYVPDLSKQKFYLFLDKYNLPIALSMLPILYFIGGWSFVLWGGFVRVMLMLHITWLVNSATHTWGYRNFDTPDDSRNNWIVAILASGEGWHNNHHAQQTCAAHGRRWFEFDVTYLMIRFLKLIGLATKVNMPKPIEPRKSLSQSVEYP